MLEKDFLWWNVNHVANQTVSQLISFGFRERNEKFRLGVYDLSCHNISGLGNGGEHCMRRTWEPYHLDCLISQLIHNSLTHCEMICFIE